MESSQRILAAEAARMAGVKVDTFWSYVSRGQAPAPVEHVGATALWDPEEILDWLRNRPRKKVSVTDPITVVER